MTAIPTPQMLGGAVTAATSPSPGYTMATAEKFEMALQQAQSTQTEKGTLVDSLLSLNEHSAALAEQMEGLQERDMKPSELMMLTMRSHEFLFHCELVSNVANRSSDGVQQLFRQQS